MSGMDAEQEMVMARAFAVSGYKAFCNVIGIEQSAWDALDEATQNGFFRAVFVVHAATEDAAELPWDEIARQAYVVYQKSVGGSEDWDQLHVTTRLAWQVFARHVLGLFEADDLTQDAIEDMEVQWSAWAERKQKELGVAV